MGITSRTYRCYNCPQRSGLLELCQEDRTNARRNGHEVGQSVCFQATRRDWAEPLTARVMLIVMILTV